VSSYIVRVEYDEQTTKEREEVLRSTARSFDIPEEEILETYLEVTLDEAGYRTWFAAICLMDPTFIYAPHYWLRDEYWVSPKTGDRTLVTRIDD
jgi:hypothetical protein